MAEDLNIVDTGVSPNPSYDEASGKIIDPDIDGGKGGTRLPTIHEEVKHAFLKQKAERDPVERVRQKAVRNGGSLEATLARIEEFDEIPDHIERHRYLDRHYGADSRVVAQHLYHGTTNERAQQEAIQGEIERGQRNFENRHPDLPRGHPLREAGAELIDSVGRKPGGLLSDRRFRGCQSVEDLFERAIEVARNNTPAGGVAKILRDRDQARENWEVSRSKRASKATI